MCVEIGFGAGIALNIFWNVKFDIAHNRVHAVQLYAVHAFIAQS